MQTDLIGWVANAFLIVCQWGIAYKYRWALCFGAAGGFLWSVKSIMTAQWDLLFIQVVIVGLQINSYIKWKNNP